MIASHDAHQSHHRSPCNHDGRKPDTRAKPLKKQVGGNFESCVSEEENGQAPVVLVGFHLEIFLEAFNLCVADVAS